ncbi:hypothetical protein BDR22DRAFT_868460 [Usnea florida]
MKKSSFSFSRIKQFFHRNRRRRSSPDHAPVEESHYGASSASPPTLSDVAIPRTLLYSSSINSQEERQHGASSAAPQSSSDVVSLRSISPPGSRTKSQDSMHIHADDLWGEALGQVSVEDKELVQAYNEILNQAAGVTGNDTQAIAQEVVRLKMTQVLNRQWRLRWRDTTFEVSKVFDSIARLVIMFKDVGSAATSADPVHAALPWAGILLLLIPIANHHQQHRDMLQGLEKITELVALYRFIVYYKFNGKAALFPRRNAHDYRGHNPDLATKYGSEIRQLYVKILKYQMKAACHLNRSRLSTFVRNIPKIDDWKGMMGEIDEQDVQCRRYETLLCHSGTIFGNIKAQKKLQDAKVYSQKKIEKIETFVSSLSTLDIERDHEHVRYRLRPEYWGSGQWLFRSSEFIAWEQRPDSVLWLQGPVGMGKSCLTSVLIERVLSRVTDEQVAFFYCSEQRSKSQAKSTDIISSILAQLARDAKDNLAQPLNDWYSRSHDRNFRKTRRPENGSETRSSTVLSRKECDDLLAQILRSGGQKTIIIDGLDECEDPAALISYFENIHVSSKKSRFFFSSRFGVRSDHQFPDATLVERLDNSADVETFVNNEIESPRRIEGSAIEDEQRDELRTLLLRHARGMFRWVELWLDLILSPEQKISHPGDIEEKLQKLRNFSKDPSREANSSLDELYFDVFKRNTQSGHRSRSLAVKALRWLLSAFKPMKIDSLVQAVALNPDGRVDGAVNEKFILRICSNFVTKTKSDTVRFAHRSVKEYLLHSHDILVKRESQSDNYHESFAEDCVHAQAAETCITFILSLGDPSWKHVPTDAKSDLSSDVSLSSFEVYSCLLWPAHCEKAGNSKKTEQYDSQLTSFLFNGATTTSNAFRRWVSLLWQYFKSAGYKDCVIEGQMRRQLEDAVSRPPNALMVACIFNLHEVARELLAREPELANSHNKRGKSALYLAAENGHCDMVRLLVESGANVEETHYDWGSIAHAAAWGGNLDAFRQVAEKVELLDDDVLDAALSGGNERLVLDALERHLDVRLPSTRRKIGHIGTQPAAYPTVKKTSLILSETAVQGIEYDKLKFDINGPIDFGYIPAYRLRAEYDMHPMFSHKKNRRLLLAMRLANVRRCEIINCFRTVNGDHKQEIRRHYHSVDPSDRKSFEPNGYKEIECRIAQASQGAGASSQRSKDFIASYWRSQKLPEMPPILEVRVGGRVLLKCPICYTSRPKTEVDSHVEWRTHIISDLRPYICPFIPECRDNELLFKDVTEWEHHLEQGHGSQTPLWRKFGDATLESMVNFNLDEYLASTAGGQEQDLCPICRMNLTPIYSAGIEGRERHVARHMENAALSILEQDEYSKTTASLSDHTQSDSQSIQSWSSGSIPSVAASNDDGEGSRANSNDSIAGFSRGGVDRGSVSSSDSREGLGVMMDMPTPREALSEGEVEEDKVSSIPPRREGKLSMDMTALRDGNDEMLSVYPQTMKKSSLGLRSMAVRRLLRLDSPLSSSHSLDP